MDFPAYTPAAVRVLITTLIEGDSREQQGWASSLANAEEILSGIERTIESFLQRGREDYLPSLRIQRAEALAHRDSVAVEVACLCRLGQDPRMAEPFALLTRIFSDDQQWENFIRSAWAAHQDFAKSRDKSNRAADQADVVVNAIETVVNAIDHFSDIGISGPDELYSIPALLGQTDNHADRGRNLHMWRVLRGYLLGDQPEREMPKAKPALVSDEPFTTLDVQFIPADEIMVTDPAEEVRNSLRYAWSTAPTLTALLGTLANKMRDFKPEKSGMVAAAIASRKQNPKTEYIRAFGYQLTKQYHFTLTQPIMLAMAHVANVVLNSPDVVVTYDDVRKALA
ncbi:hypothetical protein [Aeromonas veronii]|uniref:Uncharacterized protein n=1 Tax=Aeromonas veronii TaxID=654 RepID=A0A4S5CF12_AERVE|nr:hypothetical protein [Aeromonas veronii]THJ41516.1 hypothetical protein E8Q35_17755 [Aeromonas veronii]